MTLDDFEASAELARVTPGTRSYSAALSVLVTGLSRNSQAKRFGISQPAVSKTCKRVTTAYEILEGLDMTDVEKRQTLERMRALQLSLKAQAAAKKENAK